MTRSFFDKLCCPFDKSDLQLEVFVQDEAKNILEGLMTCTSCKRYFPIAYGVPIMTPDEYRERQLERPLLEKWKPNFEPQGFLSSGD